METALDYTKTLPPGRPAPLPLYVVYQPEEPLAFTCHFFAWDSKGKSLSFEEGIDALEDVLSEYQKTYSYEEIRCGLYPKTFDESKLEVFHFVLHCCISIFNISKTNWKMKNYMSEEEFKRVFGMTREQFASQTSWKKEDMKKALALY